MSPPPFLPLAFTVVCTPSRWSRDLPRPKRSPDAVHAVERGRHLSERPVRRPVWTKPGALS